MTRPVAVAVVVHAARVLVGRRSLAAVDAAGCAEFPGGKVEPGETTAVAAARECLEEAGVAIRLLDRVVRVAPTASGPEIAFHWAAPLDPADEPRPPFAWVPIADLSRLGFPPANAPVLAILAADHGGS
ncbi:MAG: NUDIX domain-containing protein [Planctomycetia bacterium]|nr:NUDIX domain-containing protein [Planctomycetia bacterium]